MVLWDAIFAVDPSLEIAPWVCVAMLIRIRNKCQCILAQFAGCLLVSAVIPAEYTEQLTYLMRYPPLDTPIEGIAPTALLVQQAHHLQQFPSPSTGVSVVVQNRDLLNIPVAVPDPPARPTRRTRESRAASASGRLSMPQNQSVRESQVGLPEMIARNLLDKSEGLGINRAFFNTVSEIRVRFSATLCVSSDGLLFAEELIRTPWHVDPLSIQPIKHVFALAFTRA
jgi:TBC1 domain family member 5